MTAILDDPAQDAMLCQWVEQLGGGQIDDVRRIGGGAFRTSVRVGLRDRPGNTRTLFLKIDLGSAPPTPFTLEREYQVLAALDGRGRAPRALGYASAWAAMAMECLEGEADYGRVDDAARRLQIERSYVEALNEIHRIDLTSIGLPHLPAGRSIATAVADDLALWRDLLMQGVARPDAITLFALAWCQMRLPHDNRPAVLVQGDAGPGNFLFAADHVTGVVDWEMAHVGHPLEDIGCILARSLVQPMAPANRLLDTYSEVSGTQWTPEELLYATILVMTRFSVPISLALESRNTGMDFGLTNGYFRMSQISLLSLIAQAEGLTLDQQVPETGARPEIGFEFEYLRSVLRDIIRPSLGDDYARYRLDGAVGLLSYLDAALDGGDGIEEQGDRSTISDYEQLVGEGGLALEHTVQALFTEALYRERLMRDMLGPLHGRRIAI